MSRRSLVFLLVLSAAIGLFGAGAARASWERVQVQVITIRYTTQDGFRRDAYVVLPEWYGPWSNPPLPLIISPHGRGVSAEENVDRWGDLPALGSFAVVNPEGQGRRLENFSWGYQGQIADLARMPGIVTRAIPWLRIDVLTNSGKGALAHVTTIQRVHTHGGKPSNDVCDEAHKDAETKSEYTADYYFFAPAK